MPGQFGVAFNSVSACSVLYGAIAMTLGEHLTVDTRDRILRGEYVDEVPLLFRDLEKKDEVLDNRLKERIKYHMVDRTYASWYAGSLFMLVLLLAKIRGGRCPCFSTWTLFLKLIWVS